MSEPFRLTNELFDSIKRGVSLRPHTSPLRHLYFDDRSAFWYVCKRAAWHFHGENARKLTSLDMDSVEDYMIVFDEWNQGGRKVPFREFYQAAHNR